jgi:hypothetical protein
MAQLPNILIYQEGCPARLQALASYPRHTSSFPVIAEVLAWPSPWGCTLVTLFDLWQVSRQFQWFWARQSPLQCALSFAVVIISQFLWGEISSTSQMHWITLHFTSQSLRPSLYSRITKITRVTIISWMYCNPEVPWNSCAILHRQAMESRLVKYYQARPNNL